MGNINLFLNTSVPNSGALAGLGDAFLTPIRYLFKGRTVFISVRNPVLEPLPKVHSVSSFHTQIGHRSHLVTYMDRRANGNFSDQYASQQIHWLGTVGAIIAFVPGLFIGTLLKACAYLFSSMQERHDLARQHLTPTNVAIGSSPNEILNQQDIQQALERQIDSPLHPKINAVIIHGQRDTQIKDTDERIVALNPRKIILIGPQGVNGYDPSVAEDYARLTGIYTPPVKIMHSIEAALSDNLERIHCLHGGGHHQMMYQVITG